MEEGGKVLLLVKDCQDGKSKELSPWVALVPLNHGSGGGGDLHEVGSAVAFPS